MAQTSAMLLKLPDSIQKLVHFIIQSGNVDKITLFGSRARGNARENSDYDIAVWIKDRDLWPSMLASVDEQNLTLLPIDLVIYEELSSEYRQNIDREGVLLYA